jgi:hypothetical protein
MSEIQNQIEKLKTLQESYDVLTDAVENQLPALADMLVEINSKIDGIGTISNEQIEALFV